MSLSLIKGLIKAVCFLNKSYTFLRTANNSVSMQQSEVRTVALSTLV